MSTLIYLRATLNLDYITPPNYRSVDYSIICFVFFPTLVRDRLGWEWMVCSTFVM